MQFADADTELETYWRAIVLYGRNVASYKFALAKSLLELAQAGKDSVTLEELSTPFSRHLCEHLRHSPRQATSRSSSFLDACRQFNEGAIGYDQLIATTTKLGFTNVIDAFHVVNQGEVPIRFYEKDYAGATKRIILTDEVFQLGESPFAPNLAREAESRWNLVETAWELGVSRHLITIDYQDDQRILTAANAHRRKDITSARGALNGYQKGKCFYCFTGINAADRIQTAPSEPIQLNWSNTPERYEYEMVAEDFSELFESDDSAKSTAETETRPVASTDLNKPSVSETRHASSTGLDALANGSSALPLCDVDHYFPHVLQGVIPHINFDGVWNLVLACPDCNRGEGGKFARLPELKYLARLHRRNEYLISSHHPLRETIIQQTGADEPHRRKFLGYVDHEAEKILVHRWSIEQRADATF